MYLTQPLHKAKRAVKSKSGKALLRKRGEHLERSFAHVLDHGGLRRTTLRGIENLFSAYEFVGKLVRMDWVMVLAAVALAIVSALAAALYPTWRASNVTPASQLRIQ